MGKMLQAVIFLIVVLLAGQQSCSRLPHKNKTELVQARYVGCSNPCSQSSECPSECNTCAWGSLFSPYNKCYKKGILGK
uniref:Putative secreted protein n=1 Tax=Ixodes ricinus TaxID=34613 RepID=A0A147BDB3_IXORI